MKIKHSTLETTLTFAYSANRVKKFIQAFEKDEISLVELKHDLPLIITSLERDLKIIKKVIK